MNKHTPGPWRVIPPDKDCGCYFVVRDRLGAPIGTTPDHLNDGKAYYICVFGNVMENDDAEANAMLIAAAPELLEACKEMAVALDDVGKWVYSEHRDKAAKGHAAIAKAEGKAKQVKHGDESN